MKDNRIRGVTRPIPDKVPSVLRNLPDPRTGTLARRLAANHFSNPYLHRDLGTADAGEAIALFREFRSSALSGYLPFQCSCGGVAHFNPHASVYVCQSCGFTWHSSGAPIGDLK